MGRSCYAGISVNFFIAAAFLLLFGFTAQNNGGTHGPLQLVLAVVMAGAGVLLQASDAPEARLGALGAAGLTTAVGAYLTVTGQGYVPGTIVAIIALIQLASVKVVRPSAVGWQPGIPGQPGQPGLAGQVPGQAGGWPPTAASPWGAPAPSPSPFDPPPPAPAFGQQPTAATQGQQPPAPTHGQQPPAPTHGQPPLAPTHGQPPLAPRHGQPPPAPTHRQPPPAPTHGQQPPAPTHRRPPSYWAQPGQQPRHDV